MILLGILGRAALPVLALTALTVSSWSWLADLRHPASEGPLPLTDLVAAGSAWALHAGLAWLLLITLAVLAEALAAGGSSPGSARWSRGLGCPPALRRAVLVGCGLSVLVCAVPATAAPADPSGPLDLTGLVLPDRPVGPAPLATGTAPRPEATPSPQDVTPSPEAAPTPSTAPDASEAEGVAPETPSETGTEPGPGTGTEAAPRGDRPADASAARASAPATPPATPSTPAARPGETTVVVRTGDTLWALAAERLPAPTDAAVAAEVARWSAANATTVADPDLIHPGQRLTAPGGTDHEETR